MLCDRDNEDIQCGDSNQEGKKKLQVYHEQAFVPVVVEDNGELIVLTQTEGQQLMVLTQTNKQMVSPISEIEGQEKEKMENNAFSPNYVEGVLSNFKINIKPEDKD